MLEFVHSPIDLKKMSLSELEILCNDIRKKIIQTVVKTGGHLASNLGVVELTVALHSVFNSPYDKIIWDVGHQCYAHKLLTGRKKQFSTLRQENGISGFIRAGESEHDIFISGHASTSLSAACGIAKAELMKKSSATIIAVIGDGALTGGMAYEALNNISELSNLIIIINNNNMSISKTVGGISKYLSGMRTNNTYLHTKKYLAQVLDNTPIVGKPIKQGLEISKSHIKNLVYDHNLFTALGFSYLNYVDGHSLSDLLDALFWARKSDKPVLLQVNTIKGKGMHKAEQNPDKYHSVSRRSGIDVKTETAARHKNTEDSYSAIFGGSLTALAAKDQKICAITAAMTSGTGLQGFAASYPERFFDVGIAEEHAVTFAAGLASGGMIPIFAVYSTFLQRAYDQIIHDAAINGYHIVLAIDRAGIVGDDGETHQGLFDVSFLSAIPGVTIYSPATYKELSVFLNRAIYHTDGIAAIRYPRGKQENDFIFSDYAEDYAFIQNDNDVLLVTYGRLSFEAIKALDLLKEQGIAVSLLKLNQIYPIPKGAICKMLDFSQIYFFEEGMRNGGIGQQCLDLLNQEGYSGKFSLSAVHQQFVPQSSVKSAQHHLKLDGEAMMDKIKKNYLAEVL